MAGTRKASINIVYQGNEESASAIARFSKEFIYTDPASGESDSISLTLVNTDFRWADTWIPEKKDRITAQIVCNSWNGKRDMVFDCGKFCVDDLSLSGPELTCKIKGVSVPEGNAFRSTPQNRTWEEITLKEMAAKMAEAYGMVLEYYGEPIKLGKREQSGETDCSLLKKICDEYSMGIKVYYGKVIIYDKGVFEEKNPIKTIGPTEVQSWSYNSTLVGTYTGAVIKYTSGKDNKEFSCTVGGGLRVLNLNEKVDSLADAQLKACGKINSENEKAETMTITIMGDPSIAAGSTINILGFRKIDGKYFIDKATHRIEADGAYTMDLELHKCHPRIMPILPETLVPGGDLAVGDKVIVNGPAYYAGNGGRANQCSGMTMYIIQILGSGYKYQYGVAKRKGGTRYGWCAKDSLSRA